MRGRRAGGARPAGRRCEASFARSARRCGACRGRGLRVDRRTVEAFWTRPQPEDPGFCGVGFRLAVGWSLGLVRPGEAAWPVSTHAPGRHHTAGLFVLDHVRGTCAGLDWSTVLLGAHVQHQGIRASDRTVGRVLKPHRPSRRTTTNSGESATIGCTSTTRVPPTICPAQETGMRALERGHPDIRKRSGSRVGPARNVVLDGRLRRRPFVLISEDHDPPTFVDLLDV